MAVLGRGAGSGGCIASVARVLRPGGLLSVVTELPGDPDALTLAEVEVVGFRNMLSR